VRRWRSVRPRHMTGRSPQPFPSPTQSGTSSQSPTPSESSTQTPSPSASVSTSLAASASTTEVGAVPAGRVGAHARFVHEGWMAGRERCRKCELASSVCLVQQCACVPCSPIPRAHSHQRHRMPTPPMTCAVRHVLPEPDPFGVEHSDAQPLSERLHVPGCLPVNH
jgi:hypothetical protein